MEAKLILDRGSDDKRVYLTGDLGLMLLDGCLMHKGRKDFRVKIRGYGVDITEVEEALRKRAVIKDAVVVARETDAGEARLVAYFTCSDESSLSVSELRDWLRSKIPGYTIPSAFARLDAMPITPNGKVDRNVLPDPGNSRPDLEAPYVAPTTPAEQKAA
jgi:acyl-coenzyme A synthetase/AMP-(fatty) acid ligase